MPFTADVINEINATSLEDHIDKGTVWKQNVANKPMLNAFNKAAGSFVPGNELKISFAVAAGQGGGSLAGYSGDDQVSYYNPTGTKRAAFYGKEHHIGITMTMSELKQNGIEIVESGTDQNPVMADGREQIALANELDEKYEMLDEDFAYSLDRLVHGDGTSDAKAIAGVRALILDSPAVGTTGTIGRTTNTWWRNRAATAAYGAAGGTYAITSSTSNGGALIEFLEGEWRQLGKYRSGQTRYRLFAGSDFIAAYQKELRANGYYTQTGFRGQGNDGAMDDTPKWKGRPIEWDPTLDDLGYSKRLYVIDMGRRGVRLLYMNGKRMRKHNPARPYDRYVMYNGITTDAQMVAKQLNTSGVYDIN